MEKLYRTSVWKAREKRLQWLIKLGIAFAVWLSLCGLVWEFPLSPYWLWLFILVYIAICFFAMATSYFYVISDEQGILCKNSVYRFWQERFEYSDIQTAELGITRGSYAHYIYLCIYRAERKSWKYAINLVSDEDVLRLIEELKSHGVKVSTTQAFADYYAAIERRKHEKAQGEALRRKAKAYEEQMRQERERMKK